MSTFEHLPSISAEERALGPLRQKIQFIDEQVLLTLHNARPIIGMLGSIGLMHYISDENRSLHAQDNDEARLIRSELRDLIKARKENGRHVAWVKFQYAKRRLLEEVIDPIERNLHPVRVTILREDLEKQKIAKLKEHATTFKFNVPHSEIEDIFTAIMYESRVDQIEFLTSLGICDESSVNGSTFVDIWRKLPKAD